MGLDVSECTRRGGRFEGSQEANGRFCVGDVECLWERCEPCVTGIVPNAIFL